MSDWIRNKNSLEKEKLLDWPEEDDMYVDMNGNPRSPSVEKELRGLEAEAALAAKREADGLNAEVQFAAIGEVKGMENEKKTGIVDVEKNIIPDVVPSVEDGEGRRIDGGDEADYAEIDRAEIQTAIAEADAVFRTVYQVVDTPHEQARMPPTPPCTPTFANIHFPARSTVVLPSSIEDSIYTNRSLSVVLEEEENKTERTTITPKGLIVLPEKEEKITPIEPTRRGRFARLVDWARRRFTRGGRRQVAVDDWDVNTEVMDETDQKVTVKLTVEKKKEQNEEKKEKK